MSPFLCTYLIRRTLNELKKKKPSFKKWFLCHVSLCFSVIWIRTGVRRWRCGVDRFLCRLPRPADMLFLRLLLNIFSLFHTLRLRLPLHVSDSAHGWLISEIWHYLSPFYYIEPLQILQDCLHGFFSYVYKKECRKTDTLFQIHCLQYLNLEK